MKTTIETKEFTLLAPFSIMQKDATVVDNSDDSIIKISGYASYCGMNPDGSTYSDLSNDIVNISGIDLSVWSENPIILLSHDREKVIGKGTLVEKRTDGLYIEAEIHKGAMEPEEFYRIKSGIMSYFSIGFRSVSGCWIPNGGGESWHIEKSILLEASCVALPCNSKAKYNIIKSLPNGTFSSTTEEYKEVDTQHNEEEPIMTTTLKVKRADLLSAEQLESFKSLGGNAEEVVEVALSTYIKDLVAQEVASVLAAKEKEAEEAALAAEVEAQKAAEALAAEVAEQEAAQKLAEDAAAKEAEEKMADEVAEVKALVETLKALIDAEEK